MAKSNKKGSKKVVKPVNPRRAIFALSPTAFMSLFSGRHHFEVTENPLPAGATIMDVRMERWSSNTGAIEILLEHPSIPELIEGQAVPYVKPPIFKVIEDVPQTPIATPKAPAKKRK